jgi:hypothetical protein
MELDDPQRAILGTFGAALAVSASPIRSVIGLAVMLLALYKRR